MLKTILELHEARSRSGAPSVLATVVGARGSTYRRPGARMLMSDDAWLAGAVSGGCLEADVLRKAWWRTAHGAAAVVTYDATTDDEDDLPLGFGLGCNGAIDVLLERLVPGAPTNPLTFLAAAMKAGHASVLATVVRVSGPAAACRPQVGARLLLDEGGRCEATFAGEGSDGLARALRSLSSRALKAQVSSHVSVPREGAEVEVFLEVVLPPQPLVVGGGGYDVLPVVACASQLGWDVTVVDARPTAASPRAFEGACRVVRCRPEALADEVALGPRTAAVVMSHHY